MNISKKHRKLGTYKLSVNFGYGVPNRKRIKSKGKFNALLQGFYDYGIGVIDGVIIDVHDYDTSLKYD